LSVPSTRPLIGTDQGGGRGVGAHRNTKPQELAARNGRISINLGPAARYSCLHHTTPGEFFSSGRSIFTTSLFDRLYLQKQLAVLVPWSAHPRRGGGGTRTTEKLETLAGAWSRSGFSAELAKFRPRPRTTSMASWSGASTTAQRGPLPSGLAQRRGVAESGGWFQLVAFFGVPGARPASWFGRCLKRPLGLPSADRFGLAGRDSENFPLGDRQEGCVGRTVGPLGKGARKWRRTLIGGLGQSSTGALPFDPWNRRKGRGINFCVLRPVFFKTTLGVSFLSGRGQKHIHRAWFSGLWTDPTAMRPC